MESLDKQVGYLKGLLESMDEGEKAGLNGKLISGMVELLGALSERADAVDEMLSELNDYVESIDDDLSELEGQMDDDFQDDYDDDDDFGEDQLHLLKAEDGGAPATGGLCPECGGLFLAEDGEEATYECPHCGKHVRITPLTPEKVPTGKRVRK